MRYSSPPKSPAAWFCRPFCLWAPYRMWQYRFSCPNGVCAGKQLTSAGLYKTVRRVLDVDGYFYLATEYLECTKCSQKLAAWSLPILEQLDLGHRVQFPALLTYQ